MQTPTKYDMDMFERGKRLQEIEDASMLLMLQTPVTHIFNGFHYSPDQVSEFPASPVHVPNLINDFPVTPIHLPDLINDLPDLINDFPDTPIPSQVRFCKLKVKYLFIYN